MEFTLLTSAFQLTEYQNVNSKPIKWPIPIRIGIIANDLDSDSVYDLDLNNWSNVPSEIHDSVR